MDTFDGKGDAAKPGFLRRCFPIYGWLASYPHALASVAAIRRKPPLESDLHRCQLCYDDSVVPIEAEPLDSDRWEMRLRCGQCGTYRDVIVSDGDAQRYDRELSRGMAEIAAALEREEREERARMSAEVQVFIAALEHGLIDAGDFASG